MKKTTLYAALFTSALAASAMAANNQGGAGSLDQKPAAAADNRPMPATSAPLGKPNEGSAPAPGYAPSTGAERPMANQSSGGGVADRSAGPSDPATIAERSTALEIPFAKGASSLGAEQKAKIDELIRSAKQRGQIVDVKVIGWGDVPYPGKKAEVPVEEKNLAATRSQTIENYIESRNVGLNASAINMAERPTALEDLLNSSEVRIKDSLESAGLSGPKANRGSRAMVMVILR